MAIEDLIAQSGGNIARQGMEGWNRGREIAREKQSHGLQMQIREAMLKKTMADLEKLKSDEDRKNYEQKLQDFSYKINGGWEVFQSVKDKKSGITQLRKYLENNKQAILDAGTDEDDKGFLDLMKMDDEQFLPTYNAMHKSLPMIQNLLIKQRNTVGGSEFERLDAIPEDQRTPGQQSRWEIMSGLKARPSTATKDINGYIHTQDPKTMEWENTGKLSGAQKRHDESLGYKASDKANDNTIKYRKEAAKDIGYYSNIGMNIDQTISALESGDIKLADQLAAQTMSQVNDTNVRAFQMYNEFDSSYGNVAERTYRSLAKFLSGSRTDAEIAEIKNTLLEFKKNYAEPGKERLKRFHRATAKKDGLDPFRVVPPESPEEIRDSDMAMEKKIEYLKVYFPDKFKAVK